MNTHPPIPSALNPTGEPTRDLAAMARARQSIVERIEWLERLTSNEDVQRFMEVSRRRLAVTKAKASDIDGQTQEKRDAWAQGHFELETMVEWPEVELAALKGALKKVDEKQGKL